MIGRLNLLALLAGALVAWPLMASAHTIDCPATAPADWGAGGAKLSGVEILSRMYCSINSGRWESTKRRRACISFSGAISAIGILSG